MTSGTDIAGIHRKKVYKMQPVPSLNAGHFPFLNPETGRASPGFYAELQRRKEIRNQTLPGPGRPPVLKTESDSKPVCLGIISRSKPTVSHLLIKHPLYGKDCWQIVHSELNREKAYRKLPVGQTIYLDPVSEEITWNGKAQASPFTVLPHEVVFSPGPHVQKNAPPEKDQGNQPPRISSAGDYSSSFDPGALPDVIRGYIGTPYNQLDCYELVVQGLKDMGVCYEGKEGLQHQLIQKALEKRLPINSYLTGDGLIEASSTEVYNRTYRDISDPEDEARRLLTELGSSLEPGMLISFSTPKRGHTGVISRYGNTWTLLNSGIIDNNVRSLSREKGVGEENLRAEITTWFRRARFSGETLRISIGRLDREKLSTFLKPPSTHIYA